MEESRKQFEEEINKKFGDLIDQRICKNIDGDYMAWDMQVAWWSWQASRAAIEIDVGEEPESERPDFYTGRDEVISSIREAGLKIKGE